MNPRTAAMPASGAIPLFTTKQSEADALSAYRFVMEDWAPGYEDMYVPTSFGLTHVIANGSKEARPLVLLHALFATAMSWYRNIPELSTHFRTFCVDVVGEPNLSRPTKPISSLDDFLTWFTELLDGLEIDRLHLVGNSYGGFTGAYYAMKLTDRVRRLILVAPAATISPMKPFMRHMFWPKAVYQLAPWAPGRDRVMRRGIAWMHAGLPPDPRWEPLFLEIMANGRLANRVFPRVYTQEEFAAIECPVLLVVGDNEVIYGDLDAAVDSARRLIPDVQVARIPGAHHIAALAQPQVVNEHLLRFLPAEF